jgi:hypothetical protein
MIILTSPLRLWEKIVYTRRIKKTKIKQDPIFILGHWRSGTTYLHMLMAQDKKLGYPSNLQSFLPNVFIGSARFFRRILKRSMPEKRRQDNFPLHVDYPSEEEFAIGNMSNYSFYHGLAFPNNREFYAKFVTFQDLQKKVIRKWKKAYNFYLKKLTYYHKGKQLVLKNPPNTSRVKQLLDLYPNAKFIHIHRNPYKVFPSTLKMYKSLVPPFYLQEPKIASPQDFIIKLYHDMHVKYFKERELIPEGNLIEISYEKFLEDPFGMMQTIYEELSLPGFEDAKTAMKEYIASQKTYKTNKHSLDPRIKEKLAQEWSLTFNEWGYEK